MHFKLQLKLCVAQVQLYCNGQYLSFVVNVRSIPIISNVATFCFFLKTYSAKQAALLSCIATTVLLVSELSPIARVFTPDALMPTVESIRDEETNG